VKWPLSENAPLEPPYQRSKALANQPQSSSKINLCFQPHDGKQSNRQKPEIAGVKIQLGGEQ
jgi:hypothetical protein